MSHMFMAPGARTPKLRRGKRWLWEIGNRLVRGCEPYFVDGGMEEQLSALTESPS